MVMGPIGPKGVKGPDGVVGPTGPRMSDDQYAASMARMTEALMRDYVFRESAWKRFWKRFR